LKVLRSLTYAGTFLFSVKNLEVRTVGVHSPRVAPLLYPFKWYDVDQRNGGVHPDQSHLDGEWELATAAMYIWLCGYLI
jgi:hypothetical protein